jgi:hypothetical protein
VLFEKIAAYLGIAVDEIELSGCEPPEPLVESSPSHMAESSPSIGPESPNGLVGNDPTDWCETAQSITERNTQNKQRQTARNNNKRLLLLWIHTRWISWFGSVLPDHSHRICCDNTV